MPSTPPVARRIGIASLIWAVSIMLSRVVGLVREGAIGRVLGGGRDADVFLTAFVIPDFLNYLLAGGALSIVFIPIFGGYLAKGESERGWEAFSVIANTLLLMLGAATVALWFAAPSLVPIVAPGFDAGQQADLVRLTRIVLPAQVFHLVGGLLSAALQARDKHALPAIAPLIYTSSVVVGGLIGGTQAGGDGFAWGVLVGSALGPFGLPLIGCLQAGLSWRPILSFRHPDLRIYLVRSLPIMLGWSIVVVDDWLLRRMGSQVGESAIATLHYSKVLLKVPMGVFGLAAGVAAFPTLTRLIAQDKHAEAYTTLSSAVRRMLVLALAAQVVLTCAGREVATVIYGSKIPAHQYATMGMTLGIMSLGLWAWAAQTVLSRGYYALGKTWEPTVLGTLTVVLTYPLYYYLARVGTLGLAGASAFAISLYTIVLAWRLRRYFVGVPDHYGAFILRAVPAVAAGVAAGWAVRLPLSDAPVLLRGALAGTAGALVFGAVAYVLRMTELTEVVTWGLRKVRRRPA